VHDYAARFPGVIRVVTGPGNVGMHANNRRLIHTSRGRYIAYCEGDDYWHRVDKISREVAVLEEHPEAVGVHSDVDHLELRNGTPQLVASYWKRTLPRIPQPTTYPDLIARNIVQTCSVVLRGDVLRRYPESHLASGMYPMEDWPMFLHALQSGPLMYIAESLATYRHVAGSATRRDAGSMVGFLRGERQLIDDASRGRPDCAVARVDGLSRVRDDLLHFGLVSGDASAVRDAIAAGRSAQVPERRRVQLIEALVRPRLADSMLPHAVRAARAARSGVRRLR
jgi:hypothetical protein